MFVVCALYDNDNSPYYARKYGCFFFYPVSNYFNRSMEEV